MILRTCRRLQRRAEADDVAQLLTLEEQIATALAYQLGKVLSRVVPVKTP